MDIKSLFQWSDIATGLNEWEYIYIFQLAYTNICYYANIIDYQNQEGSNRNFSPLIYSINNYSNTSCRIAALRTTVLISGSFSPQGIFGKLYAIGY